MAKGTGTALGLSIGATNLAAVAADRAITRKPVLTLYPERAPEVGIPAENPRLAQPGLVLTGFVNRVSDPRGVVAADGSVRRVEELIADAMRALAYAVTAGRPLPESVAVTYPAHWASPVVEALGAALSSVAEWSNRARPLVLVPDAAATLLAVRTNPGIPPRGTVAVCDFGGTGTSVTFMRADGDYQALAPTVRLHDFSGDLIDQALLSAVISGMPSTAGFDPAGTVAIGSLSRLRTACRTAKEELSSSMATTLSDGLTGEVGVTRGELDEAIRTPLDRFVAVLENALARNGIHDLATVVAAGGGANIPAIATTLSQYFRVPVVTTARPELTAATGAAVRAADGPGEAAVTESAPAAPVTAAGSALAAPVTAAAFTAQAAPVAPTAGGTSFRSFRTRSQTGKQARVEPAAEEPAAEERPGDSPSAKRKRRLFRLPVLAAIAGTAAAVLLVGTAVAIGLNSANQSATTPAVTRNPAPPAHTATAQPPPPTAEAPPPSTANTHPPATTETPSSGAPSAKPQHAPPLAAAPVRPAVPPIPQAPPIPAVPGLGEPIPGLDQINQIIQGIGGDLGISGIPQLGPQLGTTR